MSIVEVRTPRQMRQFVEFPYELYRADRHWIPPLRRDEYRRLSPRHNPFLHHAEMSMWLDVDGSRVTGRIAAIEDHLYTKKYRERVAWFGFFESETPASARSLIDTAEEWALRRGSVAMCGPANPS